MSSKDKKQGNYKELISFIIIGGIFVAISTLLIQSFEGFSKTKEKKVEEVVKKIIKEKEVPVSKPKCENSTSSFKRLKDKGQYEFLVKNLNAYASGGKLQNEIEKTVSIQGSDKIACGYLHFKISVNNRPMDEKYHDLYLNPHDFGGHILDRKSSFFYKKKNKYTEALIPLEAVSYVPKLEQKENIKKNKSIANWSHLLNVANNVDFIVGMSAANKNTVIKELGIAYKCWDPTSGKETSGCQLSVE